MEEEECVAMEHDPRGTELLETSTDPSSTMSSPAVKCVTTPCVTKSPDAKVVVHPPPLILTLPGLKLKTNPNQCLLESRSSCLTNGIAVGCEEGSLAMITKSSGLRALSGGDTPCCTTACPDSQLVIQPPPVCITIPGAVLTTYPNECIIQSSVPCVPSGSHPAALARSTSVSDGSLSSERMSRSTSFPSGLDSLAACVTQGPSNKVIIHPPPIEVTIPGPLLEVAAEECAVEVYNPCSTGNALTSADRQAITNGEEDEGEGEGEGQALTTYVKSCVKVCGAMSTAPCVSQGPEMKIVIQPPPIEVDLPGPILKVFPNACKIETRSPCAPQPEAICENETKALESNSEATSTALALVKRPLPNIRRAARPWAEMYSRSMTPRTIMSQQSRWGKFCNALSPRSYQPSY